MSVLLELGLDTIGLILRKVGVRPSRCVADVLAKVRRGDRSAVLLTCKRLHDVALLRGWPPWEEGCRGLLFAVARGHVEYFQLHAARAGDELPNKHFCS